MSLLLSHLTNNFLPVWIFNPRRDRRMYVRTFCFVDRNNVELDLTFGVQASSARVQHQTPAKKRNHTSQHSSGKSNRCQFAVPMGSGWRHIGYQYSTWSLRRPCYYYFVKSILIVRVCNWFCCLMISAFLVFTWIRPGNTVNRIFIDFFLRFDTPKPPKSRRKKVTISARTPSLYYEEQDLYEQLIHACMHT